MTRVLQRAAALLVALACAAVAADAPAEFVQAVEFPYYLYPRALWERELVWLKNIGIQTVAFSIPLQYHEAGGEMDLTGKTSPRRDLVGFVRLLRKLGLRGWVRWDASPRPSAWLQILERTLGPQTVSHGGPIAYVGAYSAGSDVKIDAPPPPAGAVSIAATDTRALAKSRDAIAAARGALIWTDVEDSLYPAGWAANPAPLLRKGAVGLSGDERPATAALRRDAALLRGWARLLPNMRPVAMPKPASGKLPEGVRAVQLVSPLASAVSITNSSTKPFRDELRVVEPVSKKVLVVAPVTVPAGQSLWLPVGVSIGPDGLCRDCTNFAPTEHIVYATAELLSIEFENGILAMEFAAPSEGEAILQLARRPSGPFLAAGKPTEFDWDERNLRVRLRIPAGQQAGHRVRIGLAIEAPETSAFFNDAKRLVIGRKNTVSTMYSSAEVAARSRLRLPEGYTAVAVAKSPNEIDYEVAVPADAAHGDYVTLAIEVDGVPLGRARVQLFRPASIRLLQGLQFHVGAATEITPDPPVAAIDPRAGTNLEIAIRNNTPQIQTYRLEASGEGLEFFPAKTEVSVGPADERRVELRAFGAEGAGGVRDWTLNVKGGAEVAMPMRMVLTPRGRTVAWSADLDGDGAAEWILESQKVRAVFSAQDGGRWLEFNWKDTNANFLPEGGAFAQAGTVEVHVAGDALEFTGKNWKRKVRLSETTLTVDQSAPLPAESLATEKRGNISFTVERPSATRAVYGLK